MADPKQTTKRCDECRHWLLDSDEIREIKGLGECRKAVQLWDATEWTKDANGDDDYCDRTVKPEFADQMLFCNDGSQYCASVWTKAAFFCAHHEALQDV